MHSAGCPTNKSDTTYYTVPLAGLQAEIARLQAELEKADNEQDAAYWKEWEKINSLKAELEKAERERDAWINRAGELLRERDEARNALKQDEKEVLAERRRAIKAEKALSAAKLIAWRDRQEYCAQRDEARKWARHYRSKYEDTKKGNW
jgi:predicted  nucleic acid-binding Zn-ribbon protein